MQESKSFEAFKSYINGKTVSLIGIGVSNLPLVDFLISCGAKSVICRDSNLKITDENASKAISLGGKVLLGNDYLDSLSEDIIIRSPGVRPDKPEILNAVNNGSKVYCETDLFLEFCPCKTIGITGSDGKTTTTTLISEILKKEGFNVILGGNIGMNMLTRLKECEKKNSVAVIELSSFQLFECENSPEISVITNISPNHLNWHKSFDEYIEAKNNIFKFHTKNSILISNADNKYTKELKSVGKTLKITENGSIHSGAYISDNKIYVNDNGKDECVLDISDIRMIGHHNVLNFESAILAVKDMVYSESIRYVAKTFTGVEHRIEFVREINGIKFYNSSIDSSPSRSAATLNTFENKLIAIMGGYDKNLDYTPIGNVVCDKAKAVILCGDTSEKIENAIMSAKAENKPHIYKTNDFQDAVNISYEIAKSGDIVILSPASASFDMFKNFEERGKIFKNTVMELK